MIYLSIHVRSQEQTPHVSITATLQNLTAGISWLVIQLGRTKHKLCWSSDGQPPISLDWQRASRAHFSVCMRGSTIRRRRRTVGHRATLHGDRNVLVDTGFIQHDDSFSQKCGIPYWISLVRMLPEAGVSADSVTDIVRCGSCRPTRHAHSGAPALLAQRPSAATVRPAPAPGSPSRRDSDPTCNVLAREALAPQRNDPIGHSPFARIRTAPGPRRAVGHAGTAFGLVALDPSVHDLRRRREFQRCLGLGKAAFHDRKRHLLSIHSGPPTNLKRGNSSLVGRARMDNLPKPHIWPNAGRHKSSMIG